MSLSYILHKCAKTREPKSGHCVSWCTYIGYYIRDPIPLDNPKNHITLPYITVSKNISPPMSIWDHFMNPQQVQQTVDRHCSLVSPTKGIHPLKAKQFCSDKVTESKRVIL